MDPFLSSALSVPYRLRAPEEGVGYRVCDPLGQKIGEAEEI
jgi:hypothetical protein